MTKEFFERLGSEKPAQSNVVGSSEAPIQQSAAIAQPRINGASRWSSVGDIFSGAEQTHDSLPAGLYRTAFDMYNNPVLIKQKHETDGIIEVPDDVSAKIVAEFQLFWARRKAFQDRGLLHKRGFAMWGPPGGGKTSCVNMLVKRIVTEHGGVVLFLDKPIYAAGCLRLLRLIEPDRPVVCILEDLDALVERYGEHEYLALLDGEAQVDRIVFLATTNYPEKLDRRFFDRPSRFDTIEYIGMPLAGARRAYLQAKEPGLPESELERWVAETEGFSMAHLKELIVAVKCLDQSFEYALARLEDMRHCPSSEDDPSKSPVGFVKLLANARR